VTRALVLLAVLALANAGIGALGSYVLDRAAESVVLDARRRLVAHLVWLRIPAVDRHHGDGPAGLAAADRHRSRAGRRPGGHRRGRARISRAASRAQESVGAMGTALERVLGAMRTVKASGAEQREAQRVDLAATQAWQAGVRAAKWEALAGNIAGLAIRSRSSSCLAWGAPGSPRARAPARGHRPGPAAPPPAAAVGRGHLPAGRHPVPRRGRPTTAVCQSCQFTSGSSAPTPVD
jgi:hypothetical protein